MTRKLSTTQQLIPVKITNDGYLKSQTQDKFKAFELTPLPLASLESDLNGPSTYAFFEKLSSGLARLPSKFEGQIIVERCKRKTTSNSLFDAPEQFYTRFFLIEKEIGRAFEQSFVELCSELGLYPIPLDNTQSLGLVARFFATDKYTHLATEAATLPDALWESTHIKVRENHIKAISLTEMPDNTFATLLQELIDHKDEFLISLKFKVPCKHISKKHFERKRRVSHALSIRKSDELNDIQSGSNTAATQEVLERIIQGKECIFECSLAVFQSDRNLEKLNNRSALLASKISSSVGAGFYCEEVGTLPVLRSHIPLAQSLSLREHRVLSKNLAHMLPLFCDYTRLQDKSMLALSSPSSELCYLNLFSKQNINFNAFVCGSSGSGKSFLVNSLLASATKEIPDTQITIFDIGGSYNKTMKRLEGETLKLDKASATRLVNSHLRAQKICDSSFLKGIITSFCNAGDEFKHNHEIAIGDLLRTCTGSSFNFKTLVNEALERQESAFKDIAFWLRPFLEWDNLPRSRFDLEALHGKLRSFDFKQLENEETLLKLVLFTLTDSVWRRLESGKASRSIVVFDEVWKFFASSSAYLEEMYRTFRKYKAGIITVTQSLSDYGEAAFAKLIVQISHTKILMQGAATSSVLKETLDLTDDEVKRLLSVHSLKGEFSEFWVGTPDFNQILRLYPNPDLYQMANTENLFAKGGV